MKSNKNLYNLVNSLSRTEKGYFRKYAKRHIMGRKNIYLRLFEEVNKCKKVENYDERAIRDRLKKYSRIKNFPVLKSYLYGMILKSMRAYNSDNNIEMLVHNHLEDCRFLFSKNLLQESFDALKKAKKIAARFDKFDMLYSIIKKERQIVKKSEPANVELIEKVNNELIETAEMIKNNSDYIYLNDKTNSLFNRYGAADSKVLKGIFGEILNSELLQDEKSAKTFYSLLYFYQIHSYYNFITRRYNVALSYFIKMNVLYERNPDMIIENPRNYALIVQNCMDVCYILKSEEDYNYYLNKFTGIMNNNAWKIPDNLKIYISSRSYIHELRRYTDKGDFNENKPEIKTLRKNFEDNVNTIRQEEKIILTFQFVTYYFGCGNYTESLRWLNMIINKEDELRRDLRIQCRLLFLIIHFELGNFDLLEYAVKSTYRYLLKYKTLWGIEPLIIFFLKKLVSVSTNREMRELFIEIKHKLQPHKELLGDYAFNYLAWIESRISGIKYQDAVKEMYISKKDIFEIEER
jgi:hypothetical protein